MKKIISIVSLLITIGALLSAVFVYTKFQEKDYTDFDSRKAIEIQKIVSNPSVGSSPEIDLHNDFSDEVYIDLQKVSEELENRGNIIDKAEQSLGLIMLFLGVLFIINIYFLVVFFQQSKK